MVMQQVDFTKEELLYFSWSGSGRDRISWRAATKADKAKGVVFLYNKGMTEDLRAHIALYAIGKGTEWSVKSDQKR